MHVENINEPESAYYSSGLLPKEDISSLLFVNFENSCKATLKFHTSSLQSALRHQCAVRHQYCQALKSV